MICIQLSEIEGSTWHSISYVPHLDKTQYRRFFENCEVGAYRCGARKAGVVADSFTESTPNGFRVREKTVFIIPDVCI